MLVDGDLAYLAFGQEMFAVEPGLQRVEWQFPGVVDSKNPSYYAAPAVTDGLLVVGGYDSVLYGIDRETLVIEWSFHRATGRYIGSPVLLGDTVFAATAGNELFALSLDELDRIGSVDKADEVRRSAEAAAIRWEFKAEHGIWSAPLVTADVLYVTSLDHHIYALETESGREIWATELPGAMAGTPLLSDDGATLFVGNFDHSLYALDADSGRQRWQVEAENWIWGQPALAGGKLFFGDLDGHLYAVEPDTGNVLWQQQVADAIRGGPVFDAASGHLYVASRKVANPGNISTRGSVLALDVETYRILWEQPTNEAIYTKPAVSGEMLLVAPAQGSVLLHVYSAETGVLQWEFAPHPDEK
ncbi:MAG: PQQ-like beta-propeller repeat protein [Anaerolineales bacterium]|jgi:outer membrane protein assembly factor BamB|nr:PQQ-like beta-propeller repeat protein [Anaerolineales bacterium]